MFSAYLNIDVEMIKTSYATNKYGKKTPIAAHAELERCILDLNASFRFSPATIFDGHVAIICEITSHDGERTISAVGEACNNTLNSEIAKNYPITMACNRAFDRAAIRLLKLKVDGLGPVYSDLEISPDGPRNHDIEDLTDVTPETSTSQVVTSPESVVTPTESHKNEGDVPAPSDTLVEKPNIATQVAAEETTREEKKETPADTDNGGSQIISMGKYRDLGKTVAEVFQENPKWLAHIAYNLCSSDPAINAQITSARRYIEAHAV